MPWTWRYEKADGTVVPADDLQEAIFISQGDAESWLGENWRALLAVGIDQVTLFDDTRVEYGPMSLHPEDLPANLAELLQPRGRYAPSKVRYWSGPGRVHHAAQPQSADPETPGDRHPLRGHRGRCRRGGSTGPVTTTSCLRTAVTGRGVSLSCAGQDVLIPAQVHLGLS